MALYLIIDSLPLYLIKYIIYMPVYIFIFFLTYLQIILSIEALRDCIIALLHNYAQSIQCYSIFFMYALVEAFLTFFNALYS